MNVYLTFDVEIWCGGWDQLDARFPAAFERYCYGRSIHGDFALPKTVEILNRFGLRGVFFVEPLFSSRFGQSWLARIVDIIRSGGHDVQLHLHPEWTDEIRPPIIANSEIKRQHLTLYSLAEQTELIRAGRALLEAETGCSVSAFRAGSFAANADTYRALAANGLRVDSSLNACYDYSAGTLGDTRAFTDLREIEGVCVYPVTVMRDGFGRLRPAQINGCSQFELVQALQDAWRRNVNHFVIVSHNFEMLRPESSAPDWTVVGRFEALCRFIAEKSSWFRTSSLEFSGVADSRSDANRPRVGTWATTQRFAEQAMRLIR